MRTALLMVFFGFLQFPVFAEVRVQVLETDPVPPATLASWENFSLRVSCLSDHPVRVRAEPFYNGTPIPGQNGGMPLCGPGSGEVLLWFTYVTAVHVDKVLVTARDNSTDAILAQAEAPVDLTWTGQTVSELRKRASWVETLQTEQNRQMKAAYEAYLNSPQAKRGAMLGLAIIWCLPIYVILQVVMLRYLQGGWRIAAAVPLLPMAVAFVHAVYAFHHKSNIFPLILMFASVPGLIYLVVLLIIKRFQVPPVASTNS